ncbi:hypothetical protein GOV08_03180 [Candidatus Woesearchaeota archaeon]|nr:hypothetical protein [Candidatus Woesearchaeota archaeon]
MVKQAVIFGFSIIKNPEKAFLDIDKNTLEELVKYYLTLLLVSGFLAGFANFVYSISKAVNFNIFLNVDVNYWRLLNYSFGKAMGIILLYLFIGTFIMFFISIILNIFLKMKYAQLLKLMFYSMTPLLLLGWIYPSILPLIIWSVILFVIGCKLKKTAPKLKKSSIKNRD